MGGDLQPFFAQRNIDPVSTMKRNEFVQPAPDTRADHELAIAIARLERTEGPVAEVQRSSAAAQPAGRSSHMCVPSGGRSTPQASGQGHARMPSGGQGHARMPSGGHGHARMPSGGNGEPDPSRAAPPLHGGAARSDQGTPYMESHLPVSAAKGGYSHAATAPPLQYGYSMQGETFSPDSAAGHAATLGRLPAVEAAIKNLNRAGAAGGGTPVAQLPHHQQPELWRMGSGDHYDAAIGRQMSGVQAVPLTPRVNTTKPAFETSEMARKRLEGRLKQYSLCERNIKGDGNCQFRAVADQLYRDSKYHLDVRRIAVHQLRSNPSTYSQFVPTDFWKYCWEMEQPGTWGDHVTLQAVADAFGLRINILTSYPDSPFIAISPVVAQSHRCLYLSFWAEIHYQSLFPKSEPPRSEKFLGSKTLHRLFS